MTADEIISDDDIRAARLAWTAADGGPDAGALHRFYLNLATGQAQQIAAEFRRTHRKVQADAPLDDD